MNAKFRLLTLSVLLSACAASTGEPVGSGGTGGGATGSGGTSSTGGAAATSGGTTGSAGTTVSTGAAGTGAAGQGGGTAGSIATAGSGGTTSTGGSAGGRGGSAGGPGVAGSSARGGTTGSAGRGGTTGSAGATTTGTGGQGGTAQGRDHCIDGFAPDPSDATLTMDGPVSYTKSGQTDSTVQAPVLAWMQAHVWEEAHFQWHNIRRCNSAMLDTTRDGGLNPCTHTDIVPANQEGKGAGDGLEFLAMHRHMIQSLKQLWPKHTEQFEGWDHFPTMQSQMPPQWSADWSPFTGANATNGALADDPAKNINMWATEGDFGQWIQTTSGLHGALHFKWVRTNNQDHGLGNQFVNIDNYMFWKMHGWIDKMWDKYRAAKGKTPNDQDIKDAVLKQCRQMDQLALLVKPGLSTDPTTCTPAPKQSGEFVDKIRPIFENSRNSCTGCHGQGASAGLTLGGSDCVKSSDIVAALVNKASTTGGQFKLITPNNPDQSWLFRKVSGNAASAGCMTTSGVSCITDTMPMGAGMVTLTQDELDALKTWINHGAPAPQ